MVQRALDALTDAKDRQESHSLSLLDLHDPTVDRFDCNVAQHKQDNDFDKQRRPHLAPRIKVGHYEVEPFERFLAPRSGVMSQHEQYARLGVQPIYRDIAPGKHLVAHGESIEAIARKQFGNIDHATPSTENDLKAYISEVRTLNKIAPGKQPSAGDTIVLPGHDKFGDALFKSTLGTSMVLSSNGEITTTYKDGSGYKRTYSAPDAYIDHHFGKSPSDSFDVKFNPDGTFERLNKPAAATKDLHTERDALNNLVAHKFDNAADRSRMDFQMKAFEARAKRQGVSDAEVAETYSQVSRILSASTGSPLTERQRMRAALGVMEVAAQPRDDDQGSRNTCNVTTVENRIFTREPAVGAKLVADVAATGKYVAADGTTVFIDQHSIEAHGEEALNAKPGTNHRSYASQLFQVTAVNLAHVRTNESTAPLGERRYEQRIASKKDAEDSGERFMDYRSGQAVEKHRDPQLSDNQIMQVSNQITGRNETGFFLDNKLANGPGADHTNLFSSKQEFEQKLQELTAQGKMPVIVGVYANNKMFEEDLTPDKSMLFDGHVVLAIDYDPKTRKVSIDNQWGRDNDLSCVDGKDKRVTVDELYHATLHRPANEWLDNVQSAKHSISHKEYLNRVAMIMGNYEGMWQAMQKPDNEFGSVDQADRARARNRYSTILMNLSPADRAYLKRKAALGKAEFFKNIDN